MKLRKFENRWVEAAFIAIFPACADAGLVGIEGMNLRAFTGDVLRRLPIKAKMGFRLAIWLVALAPLFVLGRWATVSRLGRGERERLVAQLASSRSYVVRSLVLLLKAFGALLYADDPRVRARMRPPVLAQSDARFRLPLVGLGVSTDAA